MVFASQTSYDVKQPQRLSRMSYFLNFFSRADAFAHALALSRLKSLRFCFCRGRFKPATQIQKVYGDKFALSCLNADSEETLSQDRDVFVGLHGLGS